MADKYAVKPIDKEHAEELDGGLSAEKRDQWLKRVRGDMEWARMFYAERNRSFDTYKSWYHKKHYETSLVDAVNLGMSGEGTAEMASNMESEHLSIINLPTDIIDMALTMIINETPNIEVLSNRESSAAQKKQTSVERLLVGAYYINTQVQGIDPIAAAALNQMLYGWGVFRALWDIDRELELDENDGFIADWMFPVVVQSLSPYDVYPIPGGRFERWRAIVYMCFRTKEEIETEWGVELERPRDDDGKEIETFDDELVEYTDYWCWQGTKIYNCVLVNNQFIKEPVEMEEYDSLPYEIFFCREGPDQAGENIGLSFLYTVLEPIREMELLANRELRAIELYADPPVVTIKAPDSPSVDIQTGPGSRIELEQGESVSYLQWQGNPPDVRSAKDFWGKLAQQFSFPDILSGSVGGTSGLDTIALQQGGMAKVFTPRRNLEMALERLNTKIVRMFQKRRPDKSLRVRGTRLEADEEHTFSFDLKGKDTRGFEYTKVTIRAKFPQEELRNAAIAQGLVASDLYSLRDTMSKFLYVQDPERMMRRRLEEKAEADPQWNAFHIKNLLVAPPQSPLSKVLDETGQAASGAPGDVTPLPGPPPDAGPVPGPAATGPEAAALATMAGGPVQGSTDNPLTQIMQQAQDGG